MSGLEGDLAIIRMQRQSACSHCELNKGCGTGAIGRLLGHRSKPLAIRNDYDLKAGDRVLVGLPDRAFLNASGVKRGDSWSSWRLLFQRRRKHYTSFRLGP